MFEQEAGMLTELFSQAEGVATTGKPASQWWYEKWKNGCRDSPTSSGNKQCNHQQSPGY